MQILIAEDDVHVRSLLHELMAPYAETIYESPDGEDALRQYAEHRPDLVLMDIRMPGTDGITATRKIVEMDSKARVLIVTEHGEAWFREDARKAGAAGYFLKDDMMRLQRYVQKLGGTTPGI